jgi:hypothetical protein
VNLEPGSAAQANGLDFLIRYDDRTGIELQLVAAALQGPESGQDASPKCSDSDAPEKEDESASVSGEKPQVVAVGPDPGQPSALSDWDKTPILNSHADPHPTQSRCLFHQMLQILFSHNIFVITNICNLHILHFYCFSVINTVWKDKFFMQIFSANFLKNMCKIGQIRLKNPFSHICMKFYTYL